MTANSKIREFKSKEDGSLLVFFVVCIVAILGLIALSFDMGRRASTQTDMQSFADNVALAAAGELDGQADSITRATAAAQSVIQAANETLKAGASGTTQQLALAPISGNPATSGLTFYTTLPATDRPASFNVANLSNPTDASYKYALPTANTTNVGTAAVYVGVRLVNVPVNWLFGNIFGGNLTISNDIGAVAISGNTAYTCEVAPLMVCLPRDTNGQVVTLSAGQGVQLQSVGQNASWFPGEFGFLDVNWLRAHSASATCLAELNGNGNEARFQACLLARGIDACFNSRTVDVQTGQRTGQEGAAFNLPFGFVGGSMNGLINGGNASVYATGPHAISGIVPNNNGCNNYSASTDTTPFPLDDCHTAGAGGTSNCTNVRFGDGNWANGRSNYVATNYTMRDSGGNVVTNGSFFDFPETLTRYQYYQREIARAANGGVMGQYGGPGSVYGADNGNTPFDTWDDYWPNPPQNGFNPIIPDNPNLSQNQQRSDNGLPQCSLPPSGNADRRVIVIAGIDCPPGAYSGTVPGNVPVAQYYRAFQLAPARDVPGTGTGNGPAGSIYQIDMEIIEPVGGQAGGSTLDNGIFREVIQLYK